MSNWGFWNWIAYATLALSAIILAAIQGSKDMTTTPSWLPEFFSKISWNYLPLVLLIISSIIFLVKQFGWIRPTSKITNDAQFIKWPDPYKPISVVGKTFTNESVNLDGHSYSH
ncbi:MAG: hypothetical protein V1742_06395, partial [Pseudomonadota bacterium]